LINPLKLLIKRCDFLSNTTIQPNFHRLSTN
jgi:hypothetical protein